MGNRYWITGVQLGMIMGTLRREPQEAFKILEEVHNNQYLCEAEELDDTLQAKRVGGNDE